MDREPVTRILASAADCCRPARICASMSPAPTAIAGSLAACARCSCPSSQRAGLRSFRRASRRARSRAPSRRRRCRAERVIGALAADLFRARLGLRRWLHQGPLGEAAKARSKVCSVPSTAGRHRGLSGLATDRPAAARRPGSPDGWRPEARISAVRSSSAPNGTGTVRWPSTLLRHARAGVDEGPRPASAARETADSATPGGPTRASERSAQGLAHSASPPIANVAQPRARDRRRLLADWRDFAFAIALDIGRLKRFFARLTPDGPAIGAAGVNEHRHHRIRGRSGRSWKS